MLRFAAVASFAALAIACGGKPSGAGPTAGGGEIIRLLPTSATHVASCDETCGNQSNPPTGGPHCGRWLPCRKYDTPQRRCEWIHNLEHGHAVLAYNCPSGCPEVVSALAGIYDARGGRRILLTPDPQLSRRVAAIVWGWAYSGDEVETAAIETVLSHQDEDAPEPGLSCAP